MATSNTPPDGIALNNYENPTPLSEQAIQQNLISILESQDSTGINIGGILGGLPVAEKNQDYFLIIEEAGDTTPEILGQTQFKISYLCDSNLNVSKPSGDGVALSNALQNFERQKNAVVRVDQGTVLNNQLAGTHRITAVGSIEPIGGTQIGKGPLDYVTTMSFVLKDQLGAAPGVDVETYYVWLNKTMGYQNTKISYATSGVIPPELANGGSALNWTNNVVSESNEDTPFRSYFDEPQIDSGSAVSFSAASVDSPGINPPPGFDSDKYLNNVNILTGSIQGNTRIKAKTAFGINIVSSSVYDLYASAVQQGASAASNSGGNLAAQQGKGGNGIGAGNYNFFQPITLNLYHESAGTVTKIATGQKSIQTRNLSLADGNGLASSSATRFALGELDNIDDFDWAPNSVAYLAVESDFFSVSQGDNIYAEIVLPEELSSSNNPINVDAAYRFTESISYWRNSNTYRQYAYIGGHIILNQETPEGANFINGVTGVTASYYTTQSDGVSVSQSLWNNSGSYWIGYNNFTSSEDGTFGEKQSYITASTPLSLFYGGDYVQVDPGTEVYNTVNASLSITSSLGAGDSKKTWDYFGFNPIIKTFTPQPGDFIRFEYSKTKTYQIRKVNSAGNVLKLLLDGHIDEGTVTDNFVIYRVVEDGQFIILDVEKNVEAGVDQKFTGLVTPQFPSTDLQEKSNTLLFDLKQAGIIKE
jgi:hypothetical protein